MIRKDIDSTTGDSTEYLEDGTVVVATKVKRSIHDIFMRILRIKCLKKYGYLRMAIDTLVRYGDTDRNRTPEIERAMMAFENLEGWKDCFNLADPNAVPEIMEAVYFLRTPKNKGYRLVMLKQPFMGQWYETYNVQDILEHTLEASHNPLYRRVRDLGVTLGTNSVMETLQVLVNDRETEAEAEELRKPFEDNERGDFGQQRPDSPTKRHPKKDIEAPEFGFEPIGCES